MNVCIFNDGHEEEITDYRFERRMKNNEILMYFQTCSGRKFLYSEYYTDILYNSLNMVWYQYVHCFEYDEKCREWLLTDVVKGIRLSEI